MAHTGAWVAQAARNLVADLNDSAGRSDSSNGDLALFTLPGPAPDGAVPARLVGPDVAVDHWLRVLRVFGYPEKRPRGQRTQVFGLPGW